jgi:hypothetical protein
MDERHEGGCQCGQLRYATIGLPIRTALCHCRYCQTRTGSAFGISAYFPRSTVTVTGKTTDYGFTTESGRRFTTHFCPTCGTNVLWSLQLSPDLIGIAAGTFDPPTFWFPLTREIFTRSAAPFIHTDLPEKHATTASYAPVRSDPAALRGTQD